MSYEKRETYVMEKFNCKMKARKKSHGYTKHLDEKLVQVFQHHIQHTFIDIVEDRRTTTIFVDNFYDICCCSIGFHVLNICEALKSQRVGCL
ncbi:CLUMA_CG012728, isoform A [Clunio marinus]|uniref:CLUMA_CG012728, isoform A n=1 Tax=Clunio marinus TaxID=568069 RepID=A0A1J1IJT0_9DIPT|nr:CLUMA_CG012728, isoform A [Clunio marinus]